MKSLFLFFAVFLLCTSSVFAYPEKCFVIKVNGDTIHGIFDFRDKEITPQLLKISTESGEKEFSPADIRIFVSQKVVYVSRNVEVPAQKASVLDISTPSFTTKFENCFLELLVSGEKDLLLLNTEQIGSFF
jgi:hypothetical protein